MLVTQFNRVVKRYLMKGELERILVIVGLVQLR